MTSVGKPGFEVCAVALYRNSEVQWGGYSQNVNLLEEMEIMRYLKSERENVLNAMTYSSGSHLFSELI